MLERALLNNDWNDVVISNQKRKRKWFLQPRYEFSFDLKEIRWISRVEVKKIYINDESDFRISETISFISQFRHPSMILCQYLDQDIYIHHLLDENNEYSKHIDNDTIYFRHSCKKEDKEVVEDNNLLHPNHSQRCWLYHHRIHHPFCLCHIQLAGHKDFKRVRVTHT